MMSVLLNVNLFKQKDIQDQKILDVADQDITATINQTMKADKQDQVITATISQTMKADKQDQAMDVATAVADLGK
jgi:UDP-N-acetyl-D-mannosaminuronic acid transferase (WecB/TagA/CpsF family)